MRHFCYQSLFIAGLLLAFASTGVAQTKARVQIRRNINGQQTEEVREFELKEGQDINEMLKEMGVLDEFGQLKQGQQFSINIDKFGDQNMQLRMLPLNPVLPPMAPMPFPRAEQHVDKPYLGIQMKTESKMAGKKAETGALITEVIAGSPAAAAGLLPGDLIVALDNYEVINTQSLLENIHAFYEPGDEVKVHFIRDGKRKSCRLELGTKPVDDPNNNFSVPEIPMIDPRDFNFDFNFDSMLIFTPGDSVMVGHPFIWDQPGMCQSQTAYLGVSPEDEQPARGIRIDVIANTPAEAMGLQTGDIVLSLNGQAVDSFDQLSNEIKNQSPGASITLEIQREGRIRQITGTLGSRTASANQDFRIFHHDRGLDENGYYNYEYQLDMQPEEMERRLEQLIEELRQKEEALMSELEQFRDSRSSLEVTIEILEITPDEANTINRTAEPKLEVTPSLELESFSFFPNPGDGELQIKFVSLARGALKVIVYDSNGGKVYLEEQQAFDGTYDSTIDITRQPAGTYYLQIMVGNKSFSKKLVKGQ